MTPTMDRGGRLCQLAGWVNAYAVVGKKSIGCELAVISTDDYTSTFADDGISHLSDILMSDMYARPESR